MSIFFSRITGLFKGTRVPTSGDPVHTFFLHTKSRAKKRVYVSALKKAQKDQEDIVRLAKEKVLAH